MSTVVVVYDQGAASPMEIRSGLAGLCDVVMALPPSAHNDALAPLIGTLGATVRIAEDPQAAAEQIRALRPDAVLTFSDRRLRLTAHLTERLGLPGHTVATTERLTDKAIQRACLRQGGVEGTASTVVAGPADWDRAVAEVGLPAVLKPRRGEGSRDTHLITDAATGFALLSATEPMVLEEYLVGADHGRVGDHMSVETVSAGGVHTLIAATGKLPLLPPFREVGDIWPAPLDPDEVAEAVALTERALTALGVHTGVSHTELKLTADGPRVIEVNGRLGGFLDELSRHATGRSLVRLAARAALGENALADGVPDVAGLEGHRFLSTTPAPRHACRVVRADGAARVRKVPGVLAYRRLVQPGARIEDTVMTQPLDLLVGTARSVPEMYAVIEAAQAEMTFEFEPAAKS